MNSRLFETFREMMESLPVKAIIRAAEAERRMVKDDLEKKRAVSLRDATSVLQFCTFLTETARGNPSSCPVWPIDHCAVYAKIVQRLVDEGELPFEVKDQFDLTFSESLGRALSSSG